MYFHTALSVSNYGALACDCAGLSFSEDTLFQGGYYNMIPAPVHVKASQILSDTLHWMRVQQVYTGRGGERFMTVGCFLPKEQVNAFEVVPNLGIRAGYYFDDFGIYALPALDAGPDKALCPPGGAVALEGSCPDCWPGLQYQWWPPEGLSNTAILNPLAAPQKTTTYYLRLLDPYNLYTEEVPCLSEVVDSVTVYVCEPESTAPPEAPDAPQGGPPPSFRWEVGPVPTAGAATVYFTGLQWPARLRFYDAQGRLVREHGVPASTTAYVLDLAELAAAPYVLCLEAGPHRDQRKLVKVTR